MARTTKSKSKRKRHLSDLAALWAKVAVFAFIIYCFVFRNSGGGLLYRAIGLLLCLPIMILPWLDKDNTSLCGKLLTTISVLFQVVLPLFLPHRWSILADIFHVAILLGVLLATWRVGQKKLGLGSLFLVWGLQILMITVHQFFFSARYSFVDHVEILPLWPVPFVIGTVLGIFIAVKYLWENSSIPGRIAYSLLSAVMFSMLLWGFTVNLNYALDMGQPQLQTVIVEGKDIDRHRKGPDDYELEFTLNGESASIEVSARQYYQYEIGDSLELYRYEGAFGVPFFLPASYAE